MFAIFGAINSSAHAKAAMQMREAFRDFDMRCFAEQRSNIGEAVRIDGEWQPVMMRKTTIPEVPHATA